MELSELRKAIDQVDDHILELIQQRASLAEQVAVAKRKQQMQAVYVPERERAILARMVNSNASVLSSSDIEAIYQALINGCRNLQFGGDDDSSFTISVQGMPGSYSEMAAREYIRHHHLQSIELHYGGGSAGVMATLEHKRAQIGLMAINNSWGGLVDETISALTGSEYEVIDTVSVQVEHYLYTTKNTSVVKHIYSHSQALRQCRHYLAQHYPDVQLHDYSDTAAAAADLAAGELGSNAAVIASATCGELYGLTEVAAKVNDKQHNETLFFVIAKAPNQ